MDAFFASVEVARRPHLAGRPVIVGGGERSVVLAATYEARAFGVHSAMPMSRARRRCPQAVVVPPDHAAYQATSRQVMALLRDVTAVVEQVSIDEAFLDVSGARRRVGPPAQIAAQIRDRVRREVGVTCSVGIAATKSVAKLASGMAKPDGVVLVPRAATLDLLRALPAGALWGVGERTAEVLARWGITTVAQLADTDLRTLQRALGIASGRHLHDLAWGRDPRPVVPDHVEKSVGAETTFPSDLRGTAEIEAHLLSLADRCAGQLRANGRFARTLSIKVRTADWRTVTRSRTLVAPTDVAREVFLVARELFAGVDLRGRGGPARRGARRGPGGRRRPSADARGGGRRGPGPAARRAGHGRGQSPLRTRRRAARDHPSGVRLAFNYRTSVRGPILRWSRPIGSAEVAMPLSEYEQRVLEQMEQQLSSDDPKLASAMHGRSSSPIGRWLISGTAVLAGLGMLVAGAATSQAWLGVVGFVLMFGAVLWAFSKPRRSGPRGVVAADGSVRRPPPAAGHREGFFKRLEGRWEKRRDQRG